MKTKPVLISKEVHEKIVQHVNKLKVKSEYANRKEISIKSFIENAVLEKMAK